MTGEMRPLRVSDTDLPLTCQMDECRNPATLTLTVELPTSWTESREYAVRRLLVAVCGDCAAVLEANAKALLEARERFARRLEMAEGAAQLLTELVALIEAVGPPFEPVQGSVFAGWLSRLDKPIAQATWRLLAHVKRKAMGGRRPRSGLPPERGRRDRADARPVPIESARFRRQMVVPPIQPLPDPPAPPTNPSPRGGDDAA